MTAFFERSKKAVGYRNPHPHFYEIKISRTAPSPIWGEGWGVGQMRAVVLSASEQRQER